MPDIAEDYTYEVLGVDSSGEARIQLTSFDSLQQFVFYRLSPGDSDGTIADVVKQNGAFAMMKWAEEREATPTITIGTPVSTTYKPMSESNEKPLVNFLTKQVSTSESETASAIITTYSAVSLTTEQKEVVYTGMSLDREQLWQKLRSGNHIDTVLSALNIRQPIHASWDATTAGSYNWDNDKIASLNVDSVSRVETGRYRVHFTNPMDDSNYSVFCTVGSTDYSGSGASPRNLSVIDRTPNYVEVLCERSDDAVNEDNFFNSVAISANKDAEEDSDFIELYNRSSFNFRDGIVQSIKTIIGKNDSDFAEFLRTD